MAAPILSQRYTYADYKSLDVDDNFLYELLNGELVKKSAPNPSHQRISGNLFLSLKTYVRSTNAGQVFYAPIDVFLDDFNAPQPDLVFVSNKRRSIITDDGIVGVPDMVVEIISPGSVVRDRVEKKKLYQAHGIPEYWIIDPPYMTIEVYTLLDNQYELLGYATDTGSVSSKVLAGFSLALQHLFALE